MGADHRPGRSASWRLPERGTDYRGVSQRISISLAWQSDGDAGCSAGSGLARHPGCWRPTCVRFGYSRGSLKALMYVRRAASAFRALALSAWGGSNGSPDFPAAIEFFQQGMELAESIGHTSAYAARKYRRSLPSRTTWIDQWTCCGKYPASKKRGPYPPWQGEYCNIGLRAGAEGANTKVPWTSSQGDGSGAKSQQRIDDAVCPHMNLGEANIRSQQYEMARENFEEGIRIAQRTHRSVHETGIPHHVPGHVCAARRLA